VFNQLEMTQECLWSIRNNTGRDVEIIIIDNGSVPSFAEDILLKRAYDISIIRNEENLGFPVAVNQGIRAAKGDVIVLLNNDVIVTPGWAERLVKWLNKYDIIGPCTNYSSGFQAVRGVGIYNNVEELSIEAVKWSDLYKDKAVDVKWVIGFCFAFKRSLYDELGEFDESLWPSSGEEIDFCLRAKQAGYRVGIAFDVYVHHEGSMTFKEMDSEHPYRGIINKSEKHLKDRWKEAYSGQGAA